jgi:hypothetical protein
MPPHSLRKICGGIAACLVLLPGPVAGAACGAQSGPARAALVELYTSEGCDSCPPADRWLNGFPANGFGRREAVPLAFHVDYWDYIGWKDAFALPDYGERQRRLAARARSGVVYTPQVIVGGADFRGWESAGFADRIGQINRAPAGADIELKLREGGGTIEVLARVSLRQQAETRPVLYIALYESGLSTEVKAGENRGRTLRHDYVVRELVGPLALEGGGTETSRTLGIKPEWRRGKLGVAAFVQDGGSGEILQALTLPLCS